MTTKGWTDTQMEQDVGGKFTNLLRALPQMIADLNRLPEGTVS